MEYPCLHFAFNAVSFIDGHRYRGGKKEYLEVQAMKRKDLLVKEEYITGIAYWCYWMFVNRRVGCEYTYEV